MSRPKVYVTRRVPQPGIDVLKPECDLVFWDSDEAIPKADLVKNVPGIDALFCLLTDPIDKDVLDAAGPQLKIVATMSVGYEHIDRAECAKRKIPVTNTPNVSTDSVAELTVSLLLLVTRRLLDGIQAVKSGEWGKWKPMWILGTELYQSTVGILGFGRIGYGVAQRLKSFGTSQILYSDVAEMPHGKEMGAKFVSFEELCRESDYICVCCNLTPTTKHAFNKNSFKTMKKTAVLVNTGRGGVIHHDDLYDALVNGDIHAAGLDVTEPEPLPADHKLVQLPNCIVLPHMGSNTWETRNNMSLIAGQNVLAAVKGKPLVSEVPP